jgi:hypothetical protein
MLESLKIKMLPKEAYKLLTLIFLLSGLIWALITPLGASPDEGAHVQYASAIQQGEYTNLISSGYVARIPANISKINDKELCYFQEIQNPVTCHIKIDSRDQELVETALRIPAYPTFYYRVVGMPLEFKFTSEVWYAMRFLSVLLSTLLIGLSIYASKEILDSAVVYGILLSITPLLSFLVGSVNPSSVEISAGISLTLLLVSYPQLARRKLWGKKQIILAIIFSTVLAIARPHSWIFLLAILTTMFVRYVSKSSPAVNLFRLSSLGILILVGVLYYLKTGAREFSLLMPPVLPQQLIEGHFSSLDNYIYDSVGYFGWIMSYRGLELVHIMWVALIFLLVIWSFQQFKINENMSLSMMMFASIVIGPIAAYYLVFKAQYGYQARYGMPILCSIPILATIGNHLNIRIPKDQLNIVAIFVPIALISEWAISGYRYSHGLPFHLLAWDLQSFTTWLSVWQITILIALFSYYLFANIKLISIVKSS